MKRQVKHWPKSSDFNSSFVLNVFPAFLKSPNTVHFPREYDQGRPRKLESSALFTTTPSPPPPPPHLQFATTSLTTLSFARKEARIYKETLLHNKSKQLWYRWFLSLSVPICLWHQTVYICVTAVCKFLSLLFFFSLLFSLVVTCMIEFSSYFV